MTGTRAQAAEVLLERVEALRSHLSTQSSKETLVLSEDTTSLIEAVFQVVKSGFPLGPCLVPICSLLEELLTIPNWIRRLTAASTLIHVANENELDHEALRRFADLLLTFLHDEKRELRDIGSLALMSLRYEQQVSVANHLVAELEQKDGSVSAHLIEGSVTYAGYFLAHAPRDATKVGLNILILSFDPQHKITNASKDYLYWHVAKALTKYLKALISNPLAAAILNIPVRSLPNREEKDKKYPGGTVTASVAISWLLEKVVAYTDVRCRKSAAEALSLYLYLNSVILQRQYLDLLKDARLFMGGNLVCDTFDLYTHAYCCMLTHAAELRVSMADSIRKHDYADYYRYFIELYRSMSVDFPTEKHLSGIYQGALIKGLVMMEYHGHSTKLVYSFSLMKRLLGSTAMHCIDGGILCALEIFRHVPEYVMGQIVEAQLYLLSNHSSLPIAVSAKKALLGIPAAHEPTFILGYLWCIMSRIAVDNADIKEAGFKAMYTLFSEHKDYIAKLNTIKDSKLVNYCPSQVLLNGLTYQTSPQASLVGSGSGSSNPGYDFISLASKRLDVPDLLAFLKIVFCVIEHTVRDTSSPMNDYPRISAVNMLEPLLDIILPIISQYRASPRKSPLIVKRAPVTATAVVVDVPVEIYTLLRGVFLLLTYTITVQSLASRSARIVGKLYSVLYAILSDDSGDYSENVHAIRERIAPLYNFVLMALYVLVYSFNIYDEDLAESARAAVPAVIGFLKILVVPVVIVKDAILCLAGTIATAAGATDEIEVSEMIIKNVSGFLMPETSFCDHTKERIEEEDTGSEGAEDDASLRMISKENVNDLSRQKLHAILFGLDNTEDSEGRTRNAMEESTDDEGDLVLMDGLATGLPQAALTLLSIHNSAIDEHSAYAERDVTVGILRALRGDDIDEDYLLHGIAYLFGIYCAITKKKRLIENFMALIKKYAEEELQDTVVGGYVTSLDFEENYPLLNSFFSADNFTINVSLCADYVPSTATVASRGLLAPDFTVLTFLLESCEMSSVDEEIKDYALKALDDLPGRALTTEDCIVQLNILKEKPKDQRCSELCTFVPIQSEKILNTKEVVTALSDSLQVLFYGDDININVYAKNALLAKLVDTGVLLPDKPKLDVKETSEFDFHKINNC